MGRTRTSSTSAGRCSGALASARERVHIITPYFLPDTALITALNVAAMRGVKVDILLPARGNLPLVQWASMAQLWQVMRPGCRVFLTSPPFDHAKLMVVDGVWSLIGSANWDPRSLAAQLRVRRGVLRRGARRAAGGGGARAHLPRRLLTLEQVDGGRCPSAYGTGWRG